MNNGAESMNTKIKDINSVEPAGLAQATILTGIDIQIKERLPQGVASPQPCILTTSLLPYKDYLLGAAGAGTAAAGSSSLSASKFGSESRFASAEGGGLSIGCPSRLFLPSPQAVSANASMVATRS